MERRQSRTFQFSIPFLGTYRQESSVHARHVQGHGYERCSTIRSVRRYRCIEKCRLNGFAFKNFNIKVHPVIRSLFPYFLIVHRGEYLTMEFNQFFLGHSKCIFFLFYNLFNFKIKFSAQIEIKFSKNDCI